MALLAERKRHTENVFHIKEIKPEWKNLGIGGPKIVIIDSQFKKKKCLNYSWFDLYDISTMLELYARAAVYDSVTISYDRSL